MAARADDPERWPFVQYSVSVGLSDNATVFGTLPGLEAGAEYLLMARAHLRNKTTGYYIFWSDVAHREVPCRVASISSSGDATRAAAPAASAGGTPDTMWIEVFRHNGNGNDPRNNITLPDYVEEHNTADLMGTFSDRWSTVYDWHENASFTRYCIEMQVVDLHNVTTPTDWVPGTSQFSDYTSCYAGQCHCMAHVDRELCGQPAEQLSEVCPDPECHCPLEKEIQSDKYIGMVHRFTNGARWYSMPEGGYCPPGARIGDAGCTYRLSPLSHSLSLGNLHGKGVFSWRPWRRAKHWLRIASAAFTDVGAEPCGGAANAVREQIMV
jgi:hypothetical protein